MVKLDALVFGYRELSVDPGDTVKLANILLKLGISSDILENGKFVIRERDVKRFAAYSAGRIRYAMSEAIGVLPLILSLRGRKGALAAIGIFLFFHVLLSSVVWDIRVEGAEKISESEITEALDDCGFGIGEWWRSIDKNATEAMFLSKFPEVSWISINRRGTVAYVRVIESENIGQIEETAPKYSNILADRDAVIEEITVVRGVAAVKVGDVVKKGDVLISGVIETEAETVFCRAEGSVIGQSVSKVSAKASKNGTEKIHIRNSVYDIKLKIFDFSINIFKNYGICSNDYDIIKDDREYALFGKYKLPLSLVRTYRSEYRNQNVLYSESQIIETAREALNDKVRTEFSECDIVKMRSFGQWMADSYVISTEIVYLTDIAYESAIEVS